MFQYNSDSSAIYSYQVLDVKTNNWSSLPTLIRRYSLTNGLCGEWLLPVRISPLANVIFPFSNFRIAVVGDSFYIAQSKEDSETNGVDLLKLPISKKTCALADIAELRVLPVDLVCQGLIRLDDSRMLLDLYDRIRERRRYALFDCNEGRIIRARDLFVVAVSPDRKSVAAIAEDGGGISLYDAELQEHRKIFFEDMPMYESYWHGPRLSWINSNAVMVWNKKGSWWLFDVATVKLLKKGTVSLGKNEYVNFALGHNKFLIKESGRGAFFQPRSYIVTIEQNGTVSRRRVENGLNPKMALTEDCFYAEEF